eukprot:UN02519
MSAPNKRQRTNTNQTGQQQVQLQKDDDNQSFKDLKLKQGKDNTNVNNNATGNNVNTTTTSTDDENNEVNNIEDSTTQNTLIEASKTYGIHAWGHPYFDVNAAGHITVEPTGRGGDAPKIDLYNLVEDCVRRGNNPPLLIRFSNIVDDKIKSLNSAFERSIIANQYDNTYQQVFPTSCLSK